MKELMEANTNIKRLENTLPEYYLGQGALYVIEDQHMILHNDALVANGPEFELHKWNTRPTLQANVDAFYKTTNDGKLLEPLKQNHALYLAISPSLVDITTLGKVHSGQFPDVKFRSNEGKIEVVAGHHRMRVLGKRNEEVLRYRWNCEDVIANANKVRMPEEETAMASRKLVETSKELLANGR